MFYLADNPGWSVNRNLAKSLGIRIHGVSIYRDQRRKQLLKKCLSASCWALSLQIAHLQCLLFYGCWFANWALYTEGKKTLKKEAGLSRADGRFNEQENLYRRLILDSCKIRTYHLPARILSLYRGPNWVQSHILSSGFNTMLSRLCPWNSSKYGNSGQNEHLRTDPGGGSTVTSEWPSPTVMRFAGPWNLQSFSQQELNLTESSEWESLFWSSSPPLTSVCWVC